MVIFGREIAYGRRNRAVTDTLWLSQSAYDRLSEELEHLQTEGRRQTSKAIEIARSHGDLRENAEYTTAKEEQGKMEARIRQLQDMLGRAEVGEAPSGDTVAAGMVLTTVDEDGDAETFLLGSREDRAQGLPVVSASSPLGKALLGCKVGDTVSYEAPAGSFQVKVTGARPLAD
ncbi:MAG: transcription elongation factor GreA [Nitriliruptorales bacterium]|nr:transcription elongation factor GreA [Nitriliruptorales bacterium]